VPAAALCVYHLVVVIRGLMRRRPPRWVGGAPTLRLAVANVFIDNEETESAAHQLVDTGADVLAVAETTPRFRAAFRAAGGDELYPWRAFDPDDASDYAVSIHTTTPPVEIGMLSLDSLRVASAVLEIDGAPAGSDHRPFVVTLAIRRHTRPSRHALRTIRPASP
jgi:hypothetical protein